MSEHTPGPWGWTYDGSSTYSIGRDEDPQGFQIASIRDRKDDRAMANARLIAAAPELLSALRALTDACLLADLIGELPGEVDGTLLNAALAAAWKAGDVATDGEQPVSEQPGKPKANVSMTDQPSPETKGSER